MHGTTEVHERAAVRQHVSLVGCARKADAETACVDVSRRTGLAARGSDEPTDALGGVSVEFDPWVGSIA